MDKIKRKYRSDILKNHCIVCELDIDKLEQQRNELLELMTIMYNDWKYIENFSEAVKDIIEKINGKPEKEAMEAI